MKAGLNYVERRLGATGAKRYIRDYHCGHVHDLMSMAEVSNALWDYGVSESEVAAHCKFMDECGNDLAKYERK